MQITVSISDAKASNVKGDALITHSLGSCIGVAVVDSRAGVAGLLHFQLPDSKIDVDRARARPLMFADSGLDWLLNETQRRGLNLRAAKVKIAGGAKMFPSNDTFDIGRRNHTAIRKALWKHGLMVAAEECGGSTPRTMLVDVASGTVTLRRAGETVEL